MTVQSYQALLDELAQLKKLKSNWYLVASAIEKLKKCEAGGKNPARRLMDASDACGYNLNTLTRMLSIKDYVDSLVEQIPTLGAMDLNTLSFPSLEVVKRLQNLDHEEGIKMLSEVAFGGITFRELRDHYNMVVLEKTGNASARRVSQMEAKEFEEAALKAICLSVEDLFGGNGKLTIKLSNAFPIPVDAIAYEEDPLHPSVGLEFILLRNQDNPKYSLETLLHRSVFFAGFFQSYWIVFSSSVWDEHIRILRSMLDNLDRKSIGLAILPWGKAQMSTEDEHLQIVRRPTGDPVPDWREKKLDEFLQIRSSMSRVRNIVRRR